MNRNQITEATNAVLLFAVVVLVTLFASVSCGQHPALDCLPPIYDDTLQTIFADEWTYYYDESNMIPAMQMGAHDPNSVRRLPATVHFGRQRFNNIDRTTNANSEFPWRVAGGLHRTDPTEVKDVKFYWHPEHKPVRYYASKRYTGQDVPVSGSSQREYQDAYDWVFPVGAVVGEILALIDDGYYYPFEIRTMTRDADAWQPRIYRQFGMKADIADELWYSNHKELARVVGSTPTKWFDQGDRSHIRPAFEAHYREATLPKLPDDVVDMLRRTPIREYFYQMDYTDSTAQLVPANYHGSQVGVDRQDCNRCHGDVAQPVNLFDHPGRDWYGYIRGSDGIFTFHPFSPESIAVNGGRLTVRFNDRLQDAGYIAPYGGQPGYYKLAKERR